MCIQYSGTDSSVVRGQPGLRTDLVMVLKQSKNGSNW